ncbi:MAG TPA: hypothetical protein VMV31_03260 [Terriglobales bacterium]|nr:hypothetical protein [Terriglobales bacterium]
MKLVGLIVRFTFVLAATALAVVLGAAAVRTALADAAIQAVQDHPDAPRAWLQQHLNQALHFRPDLSQPWRMSAQLVGADDPGPARNLELHAVALNPANWENWRDLGLLDYQLGQSRAALGALDRAAANSRGFTARFEVANLAFLLGNQHEFWREMQAALRVVPPEDVQSTLREIAHLDADPRHLLAILPVGRIRVAANAVGFLVQRRQLDQADQVWAKMTCPAYRRQDCFQALAALVPAWLQVAQAAETALPPASTPASAAASGRDRALRAPSFAARSAAAHPHSGALPAIQQAQRIWNQGIQRGALTAARVQIGTITDPQFEHFWSEIGFGWRTSSVRPLWIQDASTARANAVQVRFPGDGSDYELLFWQWILVNPGNTYAIRLVSRGQPLNLPDGVQVEVALPDGKVVQTIPVAVGPDWSASDATFRAPPGAGLLRLSFAYKRPLGKPLLRGEVWFRSATMQLAVTTKSTRMRRDRVRGAGLPARSRPVAGKGRWPGAPISRLEAAEGAATNGAPCSLAFRGRSNGSRLGRSPRRKQAKPARAEFQ